MITEEEFIENNGAFFNSCKKINNGLICAWSRNKTQSIDMVEEKFNENHNGYTEGGVQSSQ